MKNTYHILLACLGIALSMTAFGANYPKYVIVAGEHTNIQDNPDYLDLRPNDIDQHMYIWENTGTGTQGTDAPYEGGNYSKMVMNSGWFGLGFINDNPIDFSTFAHQDFILHFAIKSDADCPFFIKLESGGYPGFAKVDLKGIYDFPRDGKWHRIEIPMRAFFAQGLTWNGNMSGKNYFTLISEQAVPGKNISLDYIYFHTGIREDGTKYEANEGTISPENPTWFIVAAEHTNIDDKPEYVDMRPNGSTINMFVWENTAVGIDPTGAPFEGGSYTNLNITAPAGWFGFGFLNTASIDFSAFAKQPYTLHFAIKTTSYMPLFVKLEGADNTTATVSLAGKHDFSRDGEWHEIQIPMSDFLSQGLKWNGAMANRTFFSLLSEKADKNVSLGFDDVYFVAGTKTTHPDPSDPVAPESLPDFVIVAAEHTNIDGDPKYMDLRPNGADIHLDVWDNTATGIDQDIPAFEGAQYPNFKLNMEWFGMGFINDDPRDFTCFAHKEFILHFAVKSNADMPLTIKLEGRGEASVDLAANYGFRRDGEWHKIEIPMSEFFNQGLIWDGPMSKKLYFSLVSTKSTPGSIIGLDYIYFYSTGESGMEGHTEDAILTVFQNGNSLHIAGGDNSPIQLYNLQGRLIYAGNDTVIPTDGLTTGIYLVRQGTRSAKVIIAQ